MPHPKESPDEMGIDAVRLGARLRHARRLHQLTLKDCAQACGCSEGQLSKVERGVSIPTLALLHRLAAQLQTNVSELLGPQNDKSSPVLAAGSRHIARFGADPAGIQLERMDLASPGSLLQAHIHIVAPGARSDGLIDHIGEEVGYVLSGSVVLTVGGAQYPLSEGDAFHFASHIPHGYENRGSVEARIYWVNTPATF